MREKESKVIVDSRFEGEVCLFSLIGELTLVDAPDVGQALDRIFEKGFYKFLFDFDRLTFIDSSGISILIRFYGKLTKKEGKIAFCSFHKNVANAMQKALPLNMRQTIYFEDRNSALNYLNFI
ncbi:MAG TPA: STAS domain-containing protein [Leptospiraceae bacterium]|nr:STAS domain-containing protein [Leptospiraceae bacterium]HMW07320.1 STAS domain-containing protein [Leptospiraceae bacterium]HMX34054.1 STAS domain-containing protein [Leptospiraceae bacterium]HMY32972.1 STAS domain-containing protein [Leptospiraceae bacterium]HMZ67608.1 STAS domain-containing protein [Leptospiraceae bacterium]